MRDLMLYNKNIENFILLGIFTKSILLPFVFNRKSACLEELVKKTWGKMRGNLCGEL